MIMLALKRKDCIQIAFFLSVVFCEICNNSQYLPFPNSLLVFVKSLLSGTGIFYVEILSIFDN